MNRDDGMYHIFMRILLCYLLTCFLSACFETWFYAYSTGSILGCLCFLLLLCALRASYSGLITDKNGGLPWCIDRYICMCPGNEAGLVNCRGLWGMWCGNLKGVLCRVWIDVSTLNIDPSASHKQLCETVQTQASSCDLQGPFKSEASDNAFFAYAYGWISKHPICTYRTSSIRLSYLQSVLRDMGLPD